MLAAVLPSTLATISELILKTFPLAAALLTMEVALVVVRETEELFPYIAVIATKFGFAIFKTPYSPKSMS